MSVPQNACIRSRSFATFALLVFLALGLTLAACSVQDSAQDALTGPERILPAGVAITVADVTARGQYPGLVASWNHEGERFDAQIQYRWIPSPSSPGHSVGWTVAREFSGVYQEIGSLVTSVPYMAFPGDRVEARLYLKQPGGEAFLAVESTYDVPGLPPLQTSAMAPPGDDGALSFNMSCYWFNDTSAPLPPASDFAGMGTAMAMHNVGDHAYSITSSGEFANLLQDVRGGGTPLVWLQYMMYHGILKSADQAPVNSIPHRLYLAMCGSDGTETFPMIAKDTAGQPLDGCPSFCQEWEANPLAPGFIDTMVTVYAEEHVRGGLATFPYVGVLVDYLEANWYGWRCADGHCDEVVDLDQDGIPFVDDPDEADALQEAHHVFLRRLREVMDHVRGDDTFIIVGNGDMARHAGGAEYLDGELVERMDHYGWYERSWIGLKRALLDMSGQFVNARLPYGLIFAGVDAYNDMRQVLAIIGGGGRGRACYPDDDNWLDHPNVCPDPSSVDLGAVLDVAVDEATTTITATCENGWAALEWDASYPWAYIAVQTNRARPDTVLIGGGWARQD